MRRVQPLPIDEQLFAKGFGTGSDAAELRVIGNLGRALVRAKYFILLAALLGGIAAFAIGKSTAPRYTSVARVMIDTRVQGAGVPVFVEAVLPTTVTALESELEVLSSLDLVERVVDVLGLQSDPEFTGEAQVASPIARLLDDLRGRLKTAGIPAIFGSRSPAPGATPGLARSAVIAKVADHLKVEKVSYMSAAYAIAFTSTDSDKAARIANTFAEQYLEMQVATKLQQLDRTREWLESRVSSLNDQVVSLGRELEVLGLEAAFTTPEAHRDAQEVRDQVSARLEAARRRGDLVPDLERTLDDMNLRLKEQAAHQAEANRLESAVKVAEGMYAQAVEQLSQLQQQGGFVQPDSQIISHPRPAPYADGPGTKRLVVLGSFGSMLLASLLVGLHELLQQRLRSVDEFEQTTNLPVLGFVPRSSRRRAPLATLAGEGVLDPRLATSVRKLRASVAAVGGPQQVLAGMSALAAEGKSSTCLLFAHSYAMAGEKTLLLDMDFWRSPFRGRADPDGPGLDELVGDPDLIEGQAIAFRNMPLHVLPALRRKRDLAELRNLAGFPGFIGELRARYDRIIVDFPPVLPVVDMAALAVHADATLLVVRWNSTPRSAVKSALRVLRDVGVTPIGVVAAMVRAQRAYAFADDAFSYAHSRYLDAYESALR